MKIFEFVNKREGQVATTALFTLGRFIGVKGDKESKRGWYVVLPIVPFKSTYKDFSTDNMKTGWRLLRWIFGYRVNVFNTVCIRNSLWWQTL